ncbi:MAG: hypothetical protein IID37_09835 [Planctomycetes bacterium]|nr:hypothetical protein [Planctomycetota bacterium]
MSGIPSDIAASALQAGYQAREAAKLGTKERSGTVGADGGRERKVDEAGEVVETSDHDTQVFADADGAGSQGRSVEEEAAGAVAEKPTTAESDGISHDADGNTHLDLEA